MAKSPEAYAHLEWLGYVQPIGLVVSIPAMLDAQCYVNKNIMAEHGQFLGCLPQDERDEIIPEIRDLREFTQRVLGWEAEDFLDVPQREALTGDMASLEVVLPQYHESLRPTHVVPAFQPGEGESPWLMLVQQVATGLDLDEQTDADTARHWNAAPQAKFERLLRETEVPIGLLSNGRQLRLVYSPRGETSGYATFSVDEMRQVAGRPMFAALHMLLCAERMFSLGENERLPAILQNSRKYQNTVSTELAEQVLAALYELMRGFQAANDTTKGELLRDVLAKDPNHVYAGLLTVLMRLVFILYAEDRNLLSSDPVYSNYYSVTGLFNRLREDEGRFPDTMNQRFGAWSQLLTLFRLVYEGGQHSEFKIPPRKGYLFDVDRYPFLEGRQREDVDAQTPLDALADQTVSIPHVSDGVVFHVLKNLLILDGERLSYRTLDVEQIGSVYETVMGFNLEVAGGKSIAIKPAKTHGAPATINLDALLETPAKDRAKWLKEHADQKLGVADAKLLKTSESTDDLLTALNKKIAKKVTPREVPAGAIVLQPSDERRRSGSHYTPRSLTEPIVRTTLEPILKQLVNPSPSLPGGSGTVTAGEAAADDGNPKRERGDLPTVWQPTPADKKRYTKGEIELRIKASERKVKHAQAARTVGTPHPSQILDLKICDPAMGSGAFLVEACRQLGDELIKAWYAHDAVPTDIPPDEDEVLYARRLIAQRCLYGVDKNVMAVDLAKLSLWLVTLAKDHAFTFLDHALRHGDSLVGLTREQIIGFHWEVKKQKKFGEDLIQRRLDRATEARAKILNAREDVPYRDQQQRMASADEALDLIRLVGDACVSGFFAGQKKKEREEHAERLFGVASSYLESLTAGRGKQVDFESRRVLGQAAARLRAGSHPIPAFHWEIEFPEVFARENGGFDAFVGNPPFLGGVRIGTAFGDEYRDWLLNTHAESHGNADLVVHFFRRFFEKLRSNGTLGLIATNTIGQGDTRESGLRSICTNGGTIYNARSRVRWPGEAAVIVSVVHVFNGALQPPFYLNSKSVERITAYLFPFGSHESPKVLSANDGLSFKGSDVYGDGFFFDDAKSDGLASTVEDMHELIAANPKNSERIFPYIGGKEINTYPDLEPRRFVINFGMMDEDQCREGWPQLMSIVQDRVKPVRDKLKRASRKKYWWRFGEATPALFAALEQLSRTLVIAQTSNTMAFEFQPSTTVFGHTLVVIAMDSFAAFGTLQSRIHQTWTLTFGPTMKDDARYMPSDCFDNFPFPDLSEKTLEESAKALHEYRRGLLLSNDEGLTETYNRFHDPHEQSEGILELRRLHGLMDGAVLRAYGWDDLAESARCEFLLDYEEEEDDEPGAKKSKKKKPWRYRWPDDFRDEVLARLLELNEQRHQEELLAGGASDSIKKPAKKRATGGKSVTNVAENTKQSKLF